MVIGAESANMATAVQRYRKIPTGLPWSILRFCASLNSNHGGPLEFSMTKQKREVVMGLTGRQLGGAKKAAKVAGMSVEEWISRRQQGQARCYRCKEWKAIELFQLDRSRKGERSSLCKACVSVASRSTIYGVHWSRLSAMLKGDCQLCGRSHDKMHVDHDHETGEFRGILCSRCNTGLGLFLDSVEMLKKAIVYLER